MVWFFMCSLVTEGDCMKLTDKRGLHIDEDVHGQSAKNDL